MWLTRGQGSLEERFFSRRLRMIGAVFMFLFSALAVRLFALQIIQGERLATVSERNRLQLIFLRAPRGRILDANGDPLMDNGASFTLFFSPAPGSSPEEADRVERALLKYKELSADVVRRRLNEALRIRQFVRIAEDLPRAAAFGLIEDSRGLPGVTVSPESRRAYARGYPASHVIGYLSEATRKELGGASPEVLRMGDFVGRQGIEQAYDRTLRGRNGGMEIEVDSTGRQIRLVRSVEPVPGNDVRLTVDPRVQRAAEEALAASSTGRGAVVVLNPATGAVTALASAPSFDASGGLQGAFRDRRLPLFNRAAQGTYPLGSCFKIVTTGVALRKGLVRPSTHFNCAGTHRLGTRFFGCWKTHGRMDLYGGIAWSCDVYFYQMARLLDPEDLATGAHEFGLGRATGIDLPGEAAGLVPGPGWKTRAGRGAWYKGDTLNLAIGQGQLLVTPLQAAVMMSVVANRGRFYRPFLVREIRDRRGEVLWRNRPREGGRVELDPEHWEIMEEALRRVVTEGTGQGMRIEGWDIIGKTGTAQNPHGEDHAWFVCALRRPGEGRARLCMAVLVENGGHGGAVAVPVARRVAMAALEEGTDEPDSHGF